MTRAIAFLFPGPDCWEVFEPVWRQLRELGIEVVIADFGQHPLVPSVEPVVLRLPLFDGAETSIPRLSRRHYERMHPRLDVERCARFYHILNRFPESPEWLLMDGAYYQRLYMLAHRVWNALELARPDLALVAHGANPLAYTAAEVCRQQGIPVSYFESPFVPGRCLVDSDGMHFFPMANRITRTWPAVRAGVAGVAPPGRFRLFLLEWQSKRRSKYVQSEDASEVEMLEAWVAACRRRGHRILFLPEQIPWDASVLLGLDRFESWDHFVRHLSIVAPTDVDFIIKRHPRQRELLQYPESLLKRSLMVRNIGVHRLIQTCDAVVTFSSNVGFEALMLDKLVICGGWPHYSRQGFTRDLQGDASDEGIFAGLPEAVPYQRIFPHYADHVIHEYLLPEDNPELLMERLQEAHCRPLPDHAFPRQCEAYLRRIHVFSQQALAESQVAGIVPDQDERLLTALRPHLRDEAGDMVLAMALSRCPAPELLISKLWSRLPAAGRLLIVERHPAWNAIKENEVCLLDPREVMIWLRQLPDLKEAGLWGVGPEGGLDMNPSRPIYVAIASKT